MNGYAVVAIIIIAFAVWLYLVGVIRREGQRFNALLNPDAQRGFVMRRDLSDSARQHQRDAKIVESVMALERARLAEESQFAPHWPAGRVPARPFYPLGDSR